jgi:hypothetical protein
MVADRNVCSTLRLVAAADTPQKGLLAKWLEVV